MLLSNGMDDLQSHTEAIRRVLSSRPCGLVLDVDGTIAPIAPRPVDARVSPVCLEHMSTLAARLDLLAVISGRPVREAREMVGLEGVTYLGCHGLERLRGDDILIEPEVQAYRQRVQEVAGLLAKRLAGRPEMEGLLLEDKGISATFHYRRCPDPDRARSLILDALTQTRGIAGVRVIEARRAVELLPDVAGDKGTALMDLAAEFGLWGIFYLGDDLTDVAALRAIRQRRKDNGIPGLAVAVYASETPAEVLQESDFTLPGVPGVEGFLGLLCRLLE